MKNVPTLVSSKIPTERTIKTLTKSEMNETMRGSSLNTLRGDLNSQRNTGHVGWRLPQTFMHKLHIRVVTARDIKQAILLAGPGTAGYVYKNST